MTWIGQRASKTCNATGLAALKVRNLVSPSWIVAEQLRDLSVRVYTTRPDTLCGAT
jgi:hypothetical protein